MLYKTMIYCSRCKTTTKKLNVQRRSVFNNKTVQYCLCVDCNTAACKKWRENNTQKRRDISNRSIERYPEKKNARAQVYYHLKTGKITRPDHCSECGELTKVEAHHEDYSKPLEVEWICRRCHAQKHRKDNVTM